MATHGLMHASAAAPAAALRGRRGTTSVASCSASSRAPAVQQQLGGRGDALHRQLHLRSSQRARSRSGVSVMAVASPRDDLRLGHEAVYVDRNKTTWDVLGLGQAMVDFSATVDDSLLEGLGVEKGGRKLISHEERGQVLGLLDGESYKCNAGGSLSNTLVAISRLGASLGKSKELSVGLAGSVGSDALGEFYRSKMRHAGVSFTSPPIADGTTGTVMVLTTSDANRTMLSYIGTSGHVSLDSQLLSSVSSSRLFVIEGYLFELPETVEAIVASIAVARASGALVALTCADASVVRAHKTGFEAALEAGVDVIFANAAEAQELTGESDTAAAAAALAQRVAVAAVTDGSKGAMISSAGAGLLHVAPHWMPHPPVDTCGAGDAFAAGVLYGLLRGSPLEVAGKFGARVASAVISRHGARLPEDDAAALAKEFETVLPVQTHSVKHHPEIKGAPHSR